MKRQARNSSRAVKKLSLPRGSNQTIYNVLKTIETCAKYKTEYNGERRAGSEKKAAIAKENILEIQIIVDVMTNVLGYTGTHLLLNNTIFNMATN